MSLDLSEPLRSAVIGNISITGRIAIFADSYAVFTRRPVPEGASYPMVCISPDVGLSDADYLVERNPIVRRDISAYGQQDQAYRDVEAIGYELREMFHRRKSSIIVDGYHVVDIVASGPIPAPVDDEKLVGRMVSLTISLQKTS